MNSLSMSDLIKPEILNFYQYTKVFDQQAAVSLYQNGGLKPACAVCGAWLCITRKFRDVTTHNQSHRCGAHTNTQLIDIDALHNALSKINKTAVDPPARLCKSTVIHIKCERHGVYRQTVAYVLKGGNCQLCYHENRAVRIDFEQWQTTANTVHSNKYQYHRDTFSAVSDQTKITCAHHGDFWQNASVHSRGHGCPQCAVDQAKVPQLNTREFIERATRTHGHTYCYDHTQYTGSREPVDILCKKHGKFSQIAYYHLAGNGCPQCGIEKTTNKSAAEYEILQFLADHGLHTKHSDRSLRFELDITVPSCNMAIEYNGVYWHSSAHKRTDATHRRQHIFKTTECERAGLTLLHIMETEWQDRVKQRIWQSIMLHYAGVNDHVNHGSICVISRSVAHEFFELNHLQGKCRASVYLGLTDQDQNLIAAIAFKINSRNNEYQWQLARFAVKLFCCVPDAFRKLFDAFVKRHDPATVVAYADRRWCNGELYHKNQFQLVRSTGPRYYYTDCKRIWHQSKFQLRKQKKLLPNFDSGLTEAENMYNHGYRRIWDCGNHVFVWSKH